MQEWLYFGGGGIFSVWCVLYSFCSFVCYVLFEPGMLFPVDMSIFVFCLMVVPLPPGKYPFSVQLNNNNTDNTNNNNFVNEVGLFSYESHSQKPPPITQAQTKLRGVVWPQETTLRLVAKILRGQRGCNCAAEEKEKRHSEANNTWNRTATRISCFMESQCGHVILTVYQRPEDCCFQRRLRQ
jgi:hypothetical protein